MLAMAMTLVFVIVAIQWAAQPENWHWIAPPDPAEQAQNDRSTNENSARTPESEPLPHDVFIARADSKTKPLGSPNAEENSDTQQSGTESSDRIDPVHQNSETGDVEDSDHIAAVDREMLEPLLRDVSDNSLGVRPAELDAFYATLKYASQLTPTDLTQARTDVSFTNLQAEPEAFRGKLIRFEGEALRILPINGSENQYGLENFYEAWVRTRESGNDLYRVVFLNPDDEISLGENVVLPVTVTGIFFKRQGYNSVNGQNVAPLVLANQLTRTQFLPSEVPDESMAPYVIGFATFVGLSAVIAVWFYSRGDRKFETESRQKFTAASDEALDTLKQMSETDS